MTLWKVKSLVEVETFELFPIWLINSKAHNEQIHCTLNSTQTQELSSEHGGEHDGQKFQELVETKNRASAEWILNSQMQMFLLVCLTCKDCGQHAFYVSFNTLGRQFVCNNMSSHTMCLTDISLTLLLVDLHFYPSVNWKHLQGCTEEYMLYLH